MQQNKLITKVLVLMTLVTFSSCGKKEVDAKSQNSARGATEYAQLHWQKTADGSRYAWRTSDEQLQSLTFKDIHKHFGVALPSSDRNTLPPNNFSLIEHLINDGWELISVDRAASSKDGNFTWHQNQTYHFTKT